MHCAHIPGRFTDPGRNYESSKMNGGYGGGWRATQASPPHIRIHPRPYYVSIAARTSRAEGPHPRSRRYHVSVAARATRATARIPTPHPHHSRPYNDYG